MGITRCSRPSVFFVLDRWLIFDKEDEVDLFGIEIQINFLGRFAILGTTR